MSDAATAPDDDLDDLFLDVVQAERARSVGFDLDAQLSAERARALHYYRGEMPDVPSLGNRSRAVSTDIADAIETLLPDLIEIFTSQDDVLAFLPTGPEDEAGARQETDYLRKVVFQDNPGFKILYEFFKDALLTKTGVAVWWWEPKPDAAEAFEGKTLDETALALQLYGGQVEDLEPEQTAVELQQPGVTPTFRFTLRAPQEGSVRIGAVAPEHFTIAADASDLASATYAAWRAFPRAQALIDQGVEREVVDQLPAHSLSTDLESQARDTVSETANGLAGDGAVDDMRLVEVTTHFVRTNIDGALKLWKVVTGGDDQVLISREPVERIKIAAITPYIQPHRFYGESIADKLFEIQKIKTALKRMVLDSGYFALNQRPIVDMTKVNDFTLSDLLNNVPAAPIRVQGEGAVMPFQNGGLGFDAFSALEFFSVESEQRTGIVRNAQGLAPDTLHDTATGAIALMAAAQKRIRLIARIIAETGLKALFLGVHAELREHAMAPQVVRLRGQWVPIDPTTWGERNDMEIELGVGAGGRDADLALMMQQVGILQQLLRLQGGTATGPIVTYANVYNLVRRIFERMNVKDVDSFLTNPAPPPAAPNPALMLALAEAQANAARAQAGQAAPSQPQTGAPRP
jgi:hypothetical protein